MKKVVSAVMVLMLAVGLMIPVFASAESVTGHSQMWVYCENGKCLNVRSIPSKGGEIEYCIPSGTKVTVVGDAGNGWATIYQGNKEVGYVMTRYLVSTQPSKYAAKESGKDFCAVTPYDVVALARKKNSQESVGLRVKPTKQSQEIRRLMAGDTLQVIEVGKTWSRVVDPMTGATGYVANDYILRV